RVNSMNEWLTVNQVSKKVHIPGETVRRYARQYGDYLRIKKGEKRSYLIHESSFDTIKKIRYLLEQGYQREQVEDILRQTEVLTIQTNDDSMNEYLMNLPQLQRELIKEIKRLSEENKMHLHLIQEMKQQLDNQEKRDYKLMNLLNESLETQKQVTAAKKRGFWSWLFNKKEDKP